MIEPSYAKLAWRAKQMVDWAHVLHRQIYDLYSDDRLSEAERDRLIERVTDYYLTRKEYAFTATPKSMAPMEEQYFSRGFRRHHPKFNGLIWADHWLQIGLYEPLILAQTPADRKAAVKATLARFWSMLQDPPSGFPSVMPMTSTVAPNFSARHPRAAVIFDNLHMMHDIISDILVADTIPRDRKRAVIYAQLAEFRDRRGGGDGPAGVQPGGSLRPVAPGDDAAPQERGAEEHMMVRSPGSAPSATDSAEAIDSAEPVDSIRTPIRKPHTHAPGQEH